MSRETPQDREAARRQSLILAQLINEDRVRFKDKDLLPSAATFSCMCNRLVRLVPSHFIKDPVLGKDVQDVICQGCRGTYKDVVRVVCAKCRAVVSTTTPGYDPKLGFEFKPGMFLHVPACENCVPGLAFIKPPPKVPIVELLVQDCHNRKKDYREELQTWWTSLLQSLPATPASITPHIDQWTRQPLTSQSSSPSRSPGG